MKSNHDAAVTNVMRILTQKRIAYTPHEYAHGSEPVDGITVASLLGRDPSCVYKTLVACGASGAYYVFVIPADHELQLKKAAKAAGEKSVHMLPLAQLTPLTGYVRGGCSPIGMKKHFPTYIHHTAGQFDHIYVSAGQRGLQIRIAPGDLIREARAEVAELIREE